MGAAVAARAALRRATGIKIPPVMVAAVVAWALLHATAAAVWAALRRATNTQLFLAMKVETAWMAAAAAWAGRRRATSIQLLPTIVAAVVAWALLAAPAAA